MLDICTILQAYKNEQIGNIRFHPSERILADRLTMACKVKPLYDLYRLGPNVVLVDLWILRDLH